MSALAAAQAAEVASWPPAAHSRSGRDDGAARDGRDTVASFDGPRNGPGDNPEPGGSRGPGDDRRADLGPAADLRRRTENLPVTIRAGLREREAELGRSLEAHDRPTDRRDLVMQRLDHANILRERGEIRTALGAPDKAHQDLVDSRAALKQGWQDAEPMTGLTGSRMRINVLATAAEHAAADGDPEGANGHLDHARQTLFEWRPATVGAKAYADRTVPVWDLVRLCYAEHRAAVRLMEQEQDPAAGDSEVAWLWLNRIEQRYGKVPRSDPLWPQLKGAEAVAAVRSGRAGDLKKLSGTVANASKAFERLDSPRPDRAARLHLAMTRELVGWSNKTEGPEGGPIWEAAAPTCCGGGKPPGGPSSRAPASAAPIASGAAPTGWSWPWSPPRKGPGLNGTGARSPSTTSPSPATRKPPPSISSTAATSVARRRASWTCQW